MLRALRAGGWLCVLCAGTAACTSESVVRVTNATSRLCHVAVGRANPSAHRETLETATELACDLGPLPPNASADCRMRLPMDSLPVVIEIVLDELGGAVTAEGRCAR